MPTRIHEVVKISVSWAFVLHFVRTGLLSTQSLEFFQSDFFSQFFQSDRAHRRYSVRPRRRGIYFDAFRRSVHMHQYAEGFDRKRIDLKTLLKVDQNVNEYVSY